MNKSLIGNVSVALDKKLIKMHHTLFYDGVY